MTIKSINEAQLEGKPPQFEQFIDGLSGTAVYQDVNVKERLNALNDVEDKVKNLEEKEDK